MLGSEQLRDRLREKGLKCTGPRLAVLALVTSAESPLTHAEVVERLNDHGFDRATVYRNLIDLTEVGLLERTDLGDHVWRFELAKSGQHRNQHPHFVCSTCGDVVCLPPDAVTVTARRGSPRAVRQGQVEVQLRGMCDRCK
jgi:Fur family ferric uptake transcriptional regulator